MAIGVSMWFDAALEASVREIWRDIAGAGIGDDLHAGRYRPHVTLGIWEHADLSALVPVLERELSTWSRPTLRFGDAGEFRDPDVAYLVPSEPEALRALQARVHACLAPHVRGIDRFQRPEAWTPHCTIAWRLPDPSRITECTALARSRLPLVGEIVAIGVIDTPAEVELHRLEIVGR